MGLPSSKLCIAASSSISLDDQIIDIVQNKLKVRECVCYFQDQKQTESIGEEICRCGQKRSCHIIGDDREDVKSEWDEDSIPMFTGSNAVGQLLFKDEYSGSRKPSWYVRLTEPDAKSLPEFLKLLDCWKLFDPFPRLAISILGGSKQFKMENKSLQKFSHGLIKIATSTDAWILTEGHNFGIPRVVGDVVREGQTLTYDEPSTGSDDTVERRIRCIGISQWGLIKNRENLIICNKKSGNNHKQNVLIKMGTPQHPEEKISCERFRRHLYEPVRMYTLQKPPANEVFLNPDHSHFFFIDNGMRAVNCKRDTRFMIILMNKLFGLHKMANFSSIHHDAYAPSKPMEPIPSVIVLINGGARMINTVHHGVLQSVPFVICKNTGRAADIFSHAYEIMSDLRNASDKPYDDPKIPERTDPKFSAIRSRITKEFFKDKDESLCNSIIDQLTVRVFEAVRREQMVTVFDLASDNAEFDSVILSALLKVRDKIRAPVQLRLALTWDRQDLAEEKIFSVYSREQIQDNDANYFNSMMEKCLLESKLGFVELLISRGFSFSDYLTGNVLLRLYEEAFKSDKFIKNRFDRFRSVHTLGDLIMKNRKGSKLQKDDFFHKLNSLELIFSFISQMIAYVKPDITFSKLDDILDLQLPNPHRELFIWAILFNKPELAKFFWKKLDHPVMTAVMGSYLLKSLIDQTNVYDGDRLESYVAAKVEFEQLAIDVLDKCAYLDNHMTSIILKHRHRQWGDIDCMDAAAQADCKKFLGCHMCQEVLNDRWQMKIRSSWPLICIGIIFFPLIPLIIHFDLGESVSFAIMRKINRLTAIYKWARVDDVLKAPDPSKDQYKSHSVSRIERYDKMLRYQFSIFFRAPVTKFCFWTMFAVLYLSLYTYFLLFSYHEQTKYVDKPLEYFLHSWTFTLLLETLRGIAQSPNKTFKQKLQWWTRVVFNCTDGLALLLYIVAFILRMFVHPTSNAIEDNEHFILLDFTAKNLFAFSLFLHFIRLFNLLNVSTSLGPQLIMVGKMMVELGYFLFVLFLFLMAFGTFHAAVLYDKQLDETWPNFRLIASYSFWAFINGPEYEESVVPADVREEESYERCVLHGSCSDSVSPLILINERVNTTTPQPHYDEDPDEVAAFWLLSAWMALWVLLAFMLMNLLIAIFTNVYEEVSSNASEIWKYYQYQMITEYESKPILPPPLSFLDLFRRIYLRIKKYCRRRDKERQKQTQKENVEGGVFAEDEDQNSFVGNDPVMQFEREAQTAVYRDKKRERYANSVVQLNEIHSQLAKIESSVTRFGRLETMAEEVVSQAAQEESTKNQEKASADNQNPWQQMMSSMNRRASKLEETDDTKQAKANSMLTQILNSAKSENDPKAAMATKATSGDVRHLENRVDRLASQLAQMQRIGDLLKNTAKSMPVVSTLQPIQPLTTTPSISQHVHVPKDTSLAGRSTVETRKASGVLWLPVAGVGLTNVPRPQNNENKEEESVIEKKN